MLLACVFRKHAVQFLFASALLLIVNGCGRASKENQASQDVARATAQQLPDNQPVDAVARPPQTADAVMDAPGGATVTREYSGRSVQRMQTKSRIARIQAEPSFDAQPPVAAMESLAPPPLPSSRAMVRKWHHCNQVKRSARTWHRCNQVKR